MFALDLFNTKYEQELREGAVDKVVSEGGPYDLPGIDYDRPGDAPRRLRPSGSSTPRRHPDDPDFMDPDQRRLRADQERVKKAQDEYHAKKKGVSEGTDELAKQYGWAYNQGEYGASMTHPKHGRISLSSPITSRSGDTAVEREWTHNNASGVGDRSLAQHLQSLKEQGVAEGLNEFAPDDSGDSGEEDALHKYARMWWAGDESTQMQIERVLARMGWEIGEDEGGYDNGGVFVVRAGDINGDSYQSWAAEDLTEGVAEGVPQPGKSSGKPISWISPERVITKYLTLNEILNSVQGIPYYNEVVKDRDTKDFTWGVTKKVLEYARELIIRPDAYKNWPPIIVVDGKLQDGAHRISTINLMQKRVQPNNPIWKNAKLKVEFGESDNVRQGVAEGSGDPFGPQGRFVGDTGPAQITTTVARVQLKPGDKVLYKPTEQRARIEAMSRDGTQARIHIPSPMGGKTFNCKTSDLKALGALKEKSTSQDKSLPKKADEGKGDYVPPKEADYGDEYQARVKRVGEKARAQEKAKQQSKDSKQPTREHNEIVSSFRKLISQ